GPDGARPAVTKRENRHVRVSDYMTRKVLTAAPDDGIRETFFRMRESRIRHLPVLDGAQLVGILSDRDLRRPDWVDEAPDLSHDYQLDDNLSVSDLMSHNPISVHTYDDLAKACALINEHGFGALPVLDKGNHLVGIVSKADLVRAFARVLESNHEHV
ncbi:MAG: CBS domain-containing protein, partial [Sedimenticolaceae bacterium]